MFKQYNKKHPSIMRISLLVGMLSTHSVFAEIAVIVNTSNSSTLDKTSIERIFMGKMKKFSNGLVALPLNAAKSMNSRDEFNKAVIGRSSSQVNAFWSKLVFTGKGNMPRELSSDAEIISTISSNQGAIGYIDSGSITGDVKVIAKF
ncbi:phosphate ABC transporter substrate-binding protein [Pseudoalteromonas sp. NBT06-2]|jgi:ABC-type phosphate transport system substrate-binding protein|uniref:phosphate ABC transporter substrate-binding protein n=1 Tax=Pseudoalteromonas sp. NBT06-2 TaxID=2025950 RepID=UPI000BA541A4|nr:phosphate ABC transporter substrate-binding protein [Pseudoalteromonas sp. NBT06-2]PAJ73026.1 phosphate ABC transporter substrate-binding protein [Pseudoalteromonas sp. NBT06-2]